MRKIFYAVIIALTLLGGAPAASAQSTPPGPNLVLGSDNKWHPTAGYTWFSSDPKDLRVRWVPGTRYPTEPNVVAGQQENKWFPVAGYQWLDQKNEKDMRVVRISAYTPQPAVGNPAPPKGPSDEAVGRAVLKALGAVVLHENSKPQQGDGFSEIIARGLAKTARDELVSSALTDLLPGNTATERQAVSNLILLALDGRMPRGRDQILYQLRLSNPNFANAAETTEFLIRFAQAMDDARR
ncbi:MAG: hypothetical protein K2X38_24070 [Gemmataceae bacterium]|nr:hypothetical protein [Gemmataceae bacterium]